MTIPYLPGWGDNLAQSLPGLANGLAHVINPQMDQQAALKAAIAKDPSILQQYASIERQNPGTLASLGFGQRFGAAVGAIQASPEEAAKEAEASAINTELSTPEGKKAYGYKATRGETESETNERTAATALATSQKNAADLNARVTQDSLNKLDLQNKRYEAAFKAHPVLGNKDVAQAAADVYNGKPVDPTLLTAINGDPTLKGAFEDYQRGMVERARLAIEQGRTDAMKNANKGAQQVAINESIKLSTEAQRRVQQLQMLQAKYKGMDKDQFGLAETMAKEAAASGDTSKLDEINAYKTMLSSDNTDLADAQKDAKRYRAITMELIKQNPEFKKAIESVDAEDTKGKSNTNTTQTPDKVTQASGDPIVQQAKEYIAAKGVEKLQSLDTWKKMTPAQQKAALAFDPVEPSDSVTASPVRKAPVGTSNVPVSPTNTNPNSPPKSPSRLPLSKTERPLKETARGPGYGSSIMKNNLTPYEVMVMQGRDLWNGRPIGDYSDALGDEFKKDPDAAQSPSLPPLQRLPNRGPTVGPVIR